MGNCIKRFSCFYCVEKKEERRDERVVKKFRVVMTKAELDWLMKQLGEKQGERKLQDLFLELAERERLEEKKWRPALDSIIEVPEVQSFDNSVAPCMT
ncbi:hypothetical protein M5K25_026026 [Dendrobium thyrsiflorum]|uniref:Uncharacterized protein n=1 Tax=Dendrobium thyrsiflorum TaxID=117978 RepID=A0ABD0TWA7_DENTH